MGGRGFFWKADQKGWRETERQREAQRVCEDEAILSLSVPFSHISAATRFICSARFIDLLPPLLVFTPRVKDCQNNQIMTTKSKIRILFYQEKKGPDFHIYTYCEFVARILRGALCLPLLIANISGARGN